MKRKRQFEKSSNDIEKKKSKLATNEEIYEATSTIMNSTIRALFGSSAQTLIQYMQTRGLKVDQNPRDAALWDELRYYVVIIDSKHRDIVYSDYIANQEVSDSKNLTTRIHFSLLLS